MRLATSRKIPQTPAACRRAVALIRTDLSGTALVRHSRGIEEICQDHGIALVEVFEIDGTERTHPIGLVLLGIGSNNADAVIVPHADHLGEGLRVVAARALVISVDQRSTWLTTGEEVPIG
ncbi:hypothetical protein ACTD5D_39665 [Nocardia takedensis]|uniref:hypothetical protein n=1 Tax=Nocardia takedensis TaxID=259390 RepID=UPI003F75F49C